MSAQPMQLSSSCGEQGLSWGGLSRILNLFPEAVHHHGGRLMRELHVNPCLKSQGLNFLILNTATCLLRAEMKFLERVLCTYNMD